MSDSKVYHLDVSYTDGDKGEPIANAYGDLDIINYVAGRAEKALKGVTEDVAVTLVEVDYISGPAGRKVLGVVADGDSVAGFLRKRIRNERKASAPSVTTGTASGEAIEVG